MECESVRSDAMANEQDSAISLITEKLTELLIALLVKKPEVAAAFKDILPQLISVGVEQGSLASLDLLKALATDNNNTRQAWDVLIVRADPEARLRLMESTRQMTVEETIKKIKRERDQWDLLLNILRGTITIASLLL
jgi:hypothetical protein